MRIWAHVGLALAILAALAPAAVAHSRGARPALSGGPFPGERNCTRCHAGSEVNSGPGMLKLMVGDAAAEEYSYTPGETVSLIVSFEDSSAFRLGFQLTARSGDGCGPAGKLATARTEGGARIRLLDGTCGPTQSPVQWATHSQPRVGQSAVFEVAWTAPAESVGPITIAVAANGADGSLNVRGDNIYTAQATLQPAETMPELGPPMISEGGVTMLGDAEMPLGTAAPGAIAAAIGTDFAPADSAHAGGVSEDGAWSTVAGGVCVEVNQTRAPVLGVTAERVVFQIPANAGLGPASVQVVRDCDSPMDGPQETRSNMATLQIAKVQPAFLQFAEAHPGLAALLDDYAVVGEEGLELFPEPEPEEQSETPSMAEGMTEEAMVAEADPPAMPNPRPAMPGDTVTLLATGLGATVPALATGEIAAWPHGLAAESVKAMIGQIELPASEIVFAGAAPGFAGLYQLSLRVPSEVPAGDHPVSALIDGVASPKGPVLAVTMPPPPEPMPDPMTGEEPAMEPECTVGLVLKPGEACVGTIYSVNLGGVSIPGRFEVKESGEACLEITEGPLRSLLPDGICAEERHNPLGANLFIAERDENLAWTILTLVGPPEEEP